ncbi:MAG: hypothetical protein J6K94_07325, partial [Ruminiclostridium sp.]|nr:hypothetical protein [Ruminiclostridium sp.]
LPNKKRPPPETGTKGKNFRGTTRISRKQRALHDPVTVDDPPAYFPAETPGRTKRRHTQDGFQPVTIPL